MSTAGGPPAPRVAILADDLIWSTRLADAVRRAGGMPRQVRSTEALLGECANVDGCVVDLTARAYDGVAALAGAHSAGVPAVAVGQHDDADRRRAARAAGASRVFAYRTLHEHADRELGAWVAGLATGDRRPGAEDAPRDADDAPPDAEDALPDARASGQ